MDAPLRRLSEAGIVKKLIEKHDPNRWETDYNLVSVIHASEIDTVSTECKFKITHESQSFQRPF